MVSMKRLAYRQGEQNRPTRSFALSISIPTMTRQHDITSQIAGRRSHESSRLRYT